MVMPKVDGELKFGQRLTLKKGPGAGTIAKQLRSIEKRVAPILNDIATATSVYIGHYIDARRRRKVDRTKKRLASAFKHGEVEYTKNYISVGLGKRSTLDTKFPYWEVLNNGGYTPPVSIGFFGRNAMPDADMAGASAPGGAMDIYHQTGDKGYLMNPQRPIEGIHYLEAAQAYTKGLWSKAWRDFKQNVEHRVGFPTIGTKGIPLSGKEARG